MSRTKPALPTLKPGSYVIDTHCHLDMEDYRDDLADVLLRCRENGVAGIVTIGIDRTSSEAAVRLACASEMIRAAVGIHPHDSGSSADGDLEALARLADEHRGRVVGYGEIGLDYVKMHAPPERQRSSFRSQLAIARELGLPVIIHDREAHEDCLNIIREEGPFDRGGIMHCFSGDRAFAEQVIDLNLHISIPGIVTFKNASELQEVAAAIPLERLLLETDGPFLAPAPHRGRRNEPLYTLYTAAAVARLRQTDINDIAAQTTANATALFGYTFPDTASGAPA